MGGMATAFALNRGCYAFAPSAVAQFVNLPSHLRRHFPSCSSFSFSSSSAADDRSGHSNDNTISLVPRVSLEDFLAEPVYDRPTLIRDIIPSGEVETIAEELMTAMGEMEVQLQRKIRGESGEDDDITEIYDVTLQQAAKYMMESYHGDSFFAFCEGLLDEKSDDCACVALSSRLSKIREAPFRSENWFDYFPHSIRPTDAVILAGEGSSSTLHRDPFEWTGLSFVLEGTKIWRFVIPNEEEEGGVGKLDDALGAYRLNSVAWTTTDSNSEGASYDEKNDPLVLSRGWQSDLFLYKRRAEETPSALELLELEEDNINAYLTELEAMGTDTSVLSLDERVSDLFQSRKFNFATAIQQAGDLLIIPAHCWHQTYAAVPSIAIASQRCGAVVDGTNVVKHILGSLSSAEKRSIGVVPDVLRQSSYTEGDGKKVIDALVQHLSSLR